MERTPVNKNIGEITIKFHGNDYKGIIYTEQNKFWGSVTIGSEIISVPESRQDSGIPSSCLSRDELVQEMKKVIESHINPYGGVGDVKKIDK